MLNTIPIICYITSTILALSSVLIIIINSTTIIRWEIYNMFSRRIRLDIILEWTRIIYSSIIMFISGNVLKFSKNYIYYDHNFNRFTYTVLLFILSINLLVFIPNIICLLIGWDGLGVTSFILIIYYSNSRSLGAGVLTILINRLGDRFLLIAIISRLKTRNWLPINIALTNVPVPQLIGITVAAITKRAQLPYSRWLPAAIAAPTPVSALVHSSTLVTAGIFILIRFKILIYTSIITQIILSVTGLLTILIARISAIIENDLKKIIALSTLRQLGLITLCLGLAIFKLAFFHIICHAIFKALLFIAAGCLISLNNHNQDLRLYGQFINISPVTSSSIIIASFTIIGIPFITGYYSKHAIIEWSLSPNINILVSLLITISIFLTSYYSIRLILTTIIIPLIQNPIHINLSFNNNDYPILSISLIRIIIATNIQWLIQPIPMHQPISNKIQSTTINCLILLSIIILLIKINKLDKTQNNLKYQITLFLISLAFSTQLLTQLLPPTLLKISIDLYKYLDQSWLEKILSMGPSISLSNRRSFINFMPILIPQKNLLSISIIARPIILLYFYNKPI